MKIKTWLTDRLGIRFPIIQGAFHKFGTSELAGPVSAAGGLGIITGHCFDSPEKLCEEIRKIRAMTDNPFGVNFTIIPKKLGSCEDYKGRVDAALSAGVKVIFTSAYDGSPIGRMVKQSGGIWIHKCATIKHAISTAEKGADAIVIVGLEGTGFKSPMQNTTLINITALRRMTDTPIIAAGGIGDGYGLASALAMGACGVYLGTAFMATQQCPISVKWKKLIANQDITDPDYHRKIFHLEGLDTAPHSMASGVIESVPSIADRLTEMAAEASEVIRRLNTCIDYNASQIKRNKINKD